MCAFILDVSTSGSGPGRLWKGISDIKRKTSTCWAFPKPKRVTREKRDIHGGGSRVADVFKGGSSLF